MVVTIRETESFIKLGQALKKAGLVENGAHAKEEILSGQVSVNGETELRRGRKLKEGDVISYALESVLVVREGEDR